MEDEKITLDSKSFEALAVDSRIKIIKSLKARRKTLTELAEELGLSISAVREHLGILEKAQLISKMDDGHKWKYYSLTQKGTSLLSPKETKVWFLLSISAIALLLSAFGLVPTIYSSFVQNSNGNSASLNNYANIVNKDGNQNMYANYDYGIVTNENDSESIAVMGISNDSVVAPMAADTNEVVVKDTDGSKTAVRSANQTPDELFVLVMVAVVSGIVFLLCSVILIRNRLRSRTSR